MMFVVVLVMLNSSLYSLACKAGCFPRYPIVYSVGCSGSSAGSGSFPSASQARYSW